jgi:hypothetical protein
MANLIARIRIMLNDTLPAGSGQVFTDQNIQDVMDETRWDMGNLALVPYVTYSGSQVQYLDYYAPTGMNNWEDDLVIKQYRTVVVTPSASENILGHWMFATTTLPPLYITGKNYDQFRCAADLLERWAAQLAMCYDFSSDGQSFHRSQASAGILKLACTYRSKQRAHSLDFGRSDLTGGADAVGLGPTINDYMGSG